jgi:phosphatidylethanolamine/phosphatidyl-N-methylethanolamine N-methyltransferase
MSLDFSNFPEVQTATAWGRTLQDFADWCSPQPGWLVLDAGCGPGLLPALFSGMSCRAIGTDLNQDMFIGSRLHDALCVADTFHLPFPGAIFDQVTASNLLFLMADPPGALQELVRVLKPGGQLFSLNPSE